MSTRPISIYLLLQSLVYIALSEETELVMLIELFRHGARREFEKFQHEPGNYPGPNTGIGDLSNQGYRAHYLLGKAIRNKYADFLPTIYSPNVFQIYSSNYNRTMESAHSQLQGIFGLGNGEKLLTDIYEFSIPPIKEYRFPAAGKEALPSGIQLPPLTVSRKGFNYIFTSEEDCPNLTNKISEHARAIANKYNSTFAPLYETLVRNNYSPKKYFGKDYYSYSEAQRMCDILISLIWNKPMPFDPVLKTQCQYLVAFDMFMYYSVEEDKKIYLHKIITIIKKALEDKANGKIDSMKMIMFSGHDSNVGSIIELFKPDNYKCLGRKFSQLYPQKGVKAASTSTEECIDTILFTANIIMELRKNVKNGIFEIHFFYNNDKIGFFENGSNVIKLDKFIELAANLTDNVDFNKVCGIAPDIIPDEKGSLTAITIIATGIVIILSIMYAYLHFKVDQKRSENTIDRYIEIPLMP